MGLEVVVGCDLRSKGSAGVLLEDGISTWKGLIAAEAKSMEASTYTNSKKKVRWKFGL